jgi:hypothetical protein
VPADERQWRRPHNAAGDDLPTRDSRADLACELNLQIRAIVRSLREPADSGEELTFFCECGCLSEVRLTVGTFDAEGGAWLEGHRLGSAS